MSEIAIRSAKLEDLEILKSFEQGIVSFERSFDATLAEDPISYYDIESMILSDSVKVVVAVIGDKLIGSGYARIENPKPYLKHSKYAYLGFMYVKPNHRGKGVIGKVIESLINWSKSIDITEIRLDVYSENIGAIKAYKKAGFEEHLLNMRLK